VVRDEAGWGPGRRTANFGLVPYETIHDIIQCLLLLHSCTYARYAQSYCILYTVVGMVHPLQAYLLFGFFPLLCAPKSLRAVQRAPSSTVKVPST
jgi:hypothetical protein